jgi:hypothetical protein
MNSLIEKHFFMRSRMFGGIEKVRLKDVFLSWMERLRPM